MRQGGAHQLRPPCTDPRDYRYVFASLGSSLSFHWADLVRSVDTAQRDHLYRQLTHGSTHDSSSSLPNSSPLSSSTNGPNKLFSGAFKRSKSPPPRPSNDFTLRRKSEDRPMSPNGTSRWAFPSIAGRQSEDRPRSRQSRVSVAGSSSASNDEAAARESSSVGSRDGARAQALVEGSVSDFATSFADRSRRSSGVTTTTAAGDDGSRGGGIHKSQGSRDCVVM